jgi:hypothetical protein
LCDFGAFLQLNPGKWRRALKLLRLPKLLLRLPLPWRLKPKELSLEMRYKTLLTKRVKR